MEGRLYRVAVGIKELGERWKIRLLIVIGLWLRDKTLNMIEKRYRRNIWRG
jgi:hypothetical protein